VHQTAIPKDITTAEANNTPLAGVPPATDITMLNCSLARKLYPYTCKDARVTRKPYTEYELNAM
jgi:hypothetical protein